MQITRKLNLSSLLARKSVFLFGPRQTGKTSYLKMTFKDALIFDLLDATTYRHLSADLSRMRSEIVALNPKPKIVIIDEIQKLPSLLDEVHLLIENEGVRFILTGSSARVLKRKGVNLLAGRASPRYFHPFSYCELREHFDLHQAINNGLIPSIYFSTNAEEDLADYAGLYLREEIAAESLVRNLPSFSRFLEVASLCNGKIINYSNIASDAEIKRSTVVDYFQILRDTLIGCNLEAWTQSTKRKPIKAAKFYFFDLGLVRYLQRIKEVRPKSPIYGASFEHFIFHELKTFCDYTGNQSLHYWRSTSGFEVDFLLNEEHAIEVKAKESIVRKDLNGLRALQEEKAMKKLIVVSQEKTPRIVDGIHILPWQEFLTKLWAGEFQ